MRVKLLASEMRVEWKRGVRVRCLVRGVGECGVVIIVLLLKA